MLREGLDVYKRQEGYEKVTLSRRRVIMIKGDQELGLWLVQNRIYQNEVAAVSYTHLDVYKRQHYKHYKITQHSHFLNF